MDILECWFESRLCLTLGSDWTPQCPFHHTSVWTLQVLSPLLCPFFLPYASFLLLSFSSSFFCFICSQTSLRKMQATLPFSHTDMAGWGVYLVYWKWTHLMCNVFFTTHWSVDLCSSGPSYCTICTATFFVFYYFSPMFVTLSLLCVFFLSLDEGVRVLGLALTSRGRSTPLSALFRGCVSCACFFVRLRVFSI